MGSPKSRFALSVFLATVFAILAIGAWFAYFAFSPADAPATESIVIEIQRGQGPGDVARALERVGVVSDARMLIWLGKATRQWPKMKAGEYEVSRSMNPMEVLAKVTSGVSLNHPLTVREGENMFEIAAELEARKLTSREKFLGASRDTQLMLSLGFKPPLPPSLEGYLYPDTYYLNRTMGAEDIVRLMVKHFQAHWTPEFSARAKELGFTQHQAMTLASMVEKETGAGTERPLISSVFHNRLRKKMRLQSDPTTIYGIWEQYAGNIRKSDLTNHTPYNTYTVPALPIGPIGNPGAEAIRAALNPATSDFLFFVSHNDGTHEFTRTFLEHQGAVRRFQLDPKAREGKSWRDLGKKSGN